MGRLVILLVSLCAPFVNLAYTPGQQAEDSTLPAGRLQFGAFVASFVPDGSFSLEGQGWPALLGTWEVRESESGSELVLNLTDAPEGCGAPGRYTFTVESGHLGLSLIADECMPRRMILDGSSWRPEGEAAAVSERRITHYAAERSAQLPTPAGAEGSWPSFRGPAAAGVAEDQNLPDEWNGETGENVLWRTPIPGLAHSSPIVWGNLLFVTSAISSDATATFRPGLYGDGDASADRSTHRWMIYAFDKQTGEIVWERVAHEGEPADKRHIKSTYASSTPATDGRIVVASFGSQGVYAYDITGRFLWSVDVGRLDLGAYDIPTFEWGPASSPIIWNDMVFLQCDTQDDSFVLAVSAETGETIWKADRDELPAWGTPNVISSSAGDELVTNASNFIRGYDPATGKELWRLGRSSKITAPTPVFGENLIVVTSGRRPEQPIFVLRPGARGDITLPEGETTSDYIAWSRQRRGSYMPTPLIYQGVLYVLANNGILDAYDLASGEEIYRSRIPHLGSGFSASPVAADDKIYLSNEDGDMIVVAAGREFIHLATNPMGELLMATPALSDGVMYVRSAQSLFAIGSGS